jgi:hypothetical protein
MLSVVIERLFDDRTANSLDFTLTARNSCASGTIVAIRSQTIYVRINRAPARLAIHPALPASPQRIETASGGFCVLDESESGGMALSLGRATPGLSPRSPNKRFTTAHENRKSNWSGRDDRDSRIRGDGASSSSQRSTCMHNLSGG